MPSTIADLNGLDRDGFVAAVGHVFEHSPWIAAAAWERRPFADLEGLHRAMVEVVAAAGEERQLALIRAHPDLAGRVALAGQLTPESAREQASAGLAALSAEELERFTAYNEAYKGRFGFPFVICARERKKDAILAAFPARLAHERAQEIATALAEIAKIAWLRLCDLVLRGEMDDEIALIEELAANAVPPAVAQELDGWRLRFNWGVTRRANSVLAARHSPDVELHAKIDAVEAFYRRRGALCRFQLCPASAPAGLDALLAERGYNASPPTLVQTAPLERLLAPASDAVLVAEQFDEAWLAAYLEGEGETNAVKIGARREMLQRVGPPAGFAAARVDGQLAAVAFGVVERGWLGIFSVATRPDHRRNGLAAVALGALAAWARGYGATRTYLQVFSVNAPALRLYEKLGFATRYQYWYREKE